MRLKLKKLSYLAYLTCPLITIVFSLILGFVTMYLESTIPPLFIFISIQFYLNWYLVHRICRKVIITHPVDNCRDGTDNGSRLYWYCGRCKHYTRRPAHHCPFCKKCFYFRDHHCYFLGCCILRQNMGNFILTCWYAACGCIYSVFVVGPYLYEYFMQSDISKLNVYYFALNFFFPVTLAKFLLVNNENVHVFLVTLFNVSISIAIFTMIYGFWKFYCCFTGKQRYYPNREKSQDIYELFGSYGFLNLIFPLNGLVYSRNIDEKYELKYV
ncbi:palmitoyltransferase ZDHHC22-like [Trichogramma pretiosum]|uniref:palmitoyltransferase ZDHHC22-like n=1 Tax=Trichogramma pretiosum TaxID=7493 RepID=UPI0006C9413A|nr:palmitoyltransferase ZDHHC22-like [Trichogramma pretiosum]